MAAKQHGNGDQTGGYFLQSSRPFTSLVFILPMLLAYEIGIIALGPEAVHNGVAVWLKSFLSAVGLGRYVLLPVAVCGLLLGWHYVLRLPWRFSPRVLAGMLAETGLWASLLWLALGGYRWLADIQVSDEFAWAEVLGFCGAGIYEELLFRVVLLSSVAAIMQQAGAARRASVVTAILVSAGVFAAAHYNLFVAGGANFTWHAFGFHLICGVFFGVLFCWRGFGITAGAHAMYNIAATLLPL